MFGRYNNISYICSVIIKQIEIMGTLNQITETITMKEGCMNGNSGYIEIYNSKGELVESILRGIPTINKYFRQIENTVKTIMNETMYCFPENMPFDLQIIKNKN